MKAIVFHKYGLADELHLEDVKKPVPKDNEVLIKVHATSINASDWEFLTGSPSYVRMWGPRKPKFNILGSDIAGRIETVGSKVKQFQVGDEVFGDVMYTKGCLAEYVCTAENELALKPASMTFEEIATVPQSGVVALQGLRKGQILPSQNNPDKKILINGAGGGAGSFAVQIAKLSGAEVTGVDSTEKLDMMRSVGADHVIDYTKENFTQNKQRYDFILDFVASHSIFDCKRVLNPRGIYVLVGGTTSRIFQGIFIGAWLSMIGNKKMGLLAWQPSISDLLFITELIEAEKIIPVIDKRYPLSETAEAFRYFGEGRAKGKVVITMEENLSNYPQMNTDKR